MKFLGNSGNKYLKVQFDPSHPLPWFAESVLLISPEHGAQQTLWPGEAWCASHLKQP